MEAECISKAQRLSLDIITTLPQVIIETILCLLPLEEAARTSILSKEWRYKWTKIPKLVLRQSELEMSAKEWIRHGSPRSKILYVAHQVLLQRQGPIQEFSLLMGCSFCASIEPQVDQIMRLLLSKHTLNKLTLDFGGGVHNSYRIYDLSLSVFWTPHLTGLYLKHCNVTVKPIFGGFGSLTSLTLYGIHISIEALLQLLSRCPSLKRLRLMPQHTFGETCIMELFKCLPVIEHLTICSEIFKLPKEITVSLIHLKYFCIEDLGFGPLRSGLSFFLVLTESSPYVEKIKLEIGDEDFPDKEYSMILDKFSNVRLEHLNELVIDSFINYKFHMVFVKFILDRSPNLKKVILQLNFWIFDEAHEIIKASLHAIRPQPVEIIVEKI